MSILTLDEIEAIYADGKGMEEFARAIERAVVTKNGPAEMIALREELAGCHKRANEICGKLLAAQLDARKMRDAQDVIRIEAEILTTASKGTYPLPYENVERIGRTILAAIAPEKKPCPVLGAHNGDGSPTPGCTCGKS